MGRELPFDSKMSAEGEWAVTFKAPLSYENSSVIWESFSRLFLENSPSSLVLDLAEVSKVDSAGVALLRSIQRLCERRAVPVRLESISPSTQHFLDYLHHKSKPPEGTADSTGGVAKLGNLVIQRTDEIRDFIHFFGDFLLTSIRILYNFRRFRFNEMFYYLQLSGSSAMSIVFMVSFLLGMVMAYQAAIQLKQFGANIFVADLVSLALSRELAPVFTAMLLAGRSGSAFAAEIGTMKVGEEIDALTVMGFNLTDYIVVPKVFALMIAGPLLTMWSNFSGLLGGIFVSGISLDLTAYSFMYEVYTILSVTDILSGLIKAEVFAVLIALIGCFRGFQTGKGADSVGRQTTSAVVSGIFLVIFADAIFTVFFHTIGW